jgi:hypothetical protein
MSVALGAESVGKKKAKAKSAPAERKPMVLQMRGSEEWKAWAEGLADHERDTLAKLVERLFAQKAKEVGYPPPPRR